MKITITYPPDEEAEALVAAMLCRRWYPTAEVVKEPDAASRTDDEPNSGPICSTALT